MITRFDRIHERDRRTHTHRRTPHDGIGRAYAQHRVATTTCPISLLPSFDINIIHSYFSVCYFNKFYEKANSILYIHKLKLAKKIITQ